MRSVMGIPVVAVLLAGAAAFAGGGGKIDWQRDKPLDEIVRQAKESDRIIMVYFAAEWDGFCTQQDAEAFSDDAVVKGSEAFVRLLIDCTDKQALEANKKNFRFFRNVPTVVFISPDGTRLLDIAEGATGPAVFLKKFEAVGKVAAGIEVERKIIQRMEDRIAIELAESQERLSRQMGKIIREAIDEFRRGGARPPGPRPPAPTPTPATPGARPAYIGLVPDDQFTDAQRKELGLSNSAGVRIAEVRKGGPAEKGGLLPGDVLVQLGSTAITDRNLGDALRGYKAGDSAECTVIRGKDRQTLRITFAERK